MALPALTANHYVRTPSGRHFVPSDLGVPACLVAHVPSLSAPTRSGVSLSKRGVAWWNARQKAEWFKYNDYFQPPEGGLPEGYTPPPVAVWADEYRLLDDANPGTAEAPNMRRAKLSAPAALYLPAGHVVAFCEKKRDAAFMGGLAGSDVPDANEGVDPTEFGVYFDDGTGEMGTVGCLYTEAYCRRMGLEHRYEHRLKRSDCFLPAGQEGSEMILGTTVTRGAKAAGEAMLGRNCDPDCKPTEYCLFFQCHPKREVGETVPVGEAFRCLSGHEYWGKCAECTSSRAECDYLSPAASGADCSDGTCICTAGACVTEKKAGELDENGDNCASRTAGYWKWGQTKRCCRTDELATDVYGVDPYCAVLRRGDDCQAESQCAKAGAVCRGGKCKGRRSTHPPALDAPCAGGSGKAGLPCQLVGESDKAFAYNHDQPDALNLLSAFGNATQRAHLLCKAEGERRGTFLAAEVGEEVQWGHRGEGKKAWMVATCVPDPRRAEYDPAKDGRGNPSCSTKAFRESGKGECVSDWADSEQKLEQACKDIGKDAAGAGKKGIVFLPKHHVSGGAGLYQRGEGGKLRTRCEMCRPGTEGTACAEHDASLLTRLGEHPDLCSPASGGGSCFVQVKRSDLLDEEDVATANRSLHGRSVRRPRGGEAVSFQTRFLAEGSRWIRRHYASVLLNPPQSVVKCDDPNFLNRITRDVLTGGNGGGATCTTTKGMCHNDRPCHTKDPKPQCRAINAERGGPKFDGFTAVAGNEAVKHDWGDFRHGNYTYQCQINSSQDRSAILAEADGWGFLCSKATPCDSGYECRYGRCLKREGSVSSGKCLDGSECAQGKGGQRLQCSGNRCICNDNMHCPGSQVCSNGSHGGTKHSCREPPVVTEHGATCGGSQDVRCGGGLQCRGGKCLKPEGSVGGMAKCVDGSECAQGKGGQRLQCSGNRCICNSNMHCPGSQVCSNGSHGGTRNACREPPVVTEHGATCGGSQDVRCGGGLQCRGGKCLKPEGSVGGMARCLDGTECARGKGGQRMQCSGHRCICHSNMHCPGSQVCSNGSHGGTRNACREPPVVHGVGAMCAGSQGERCGGGLECRNHRCSRRRHSVHVGGHCSNQEECAHGKGGHYLHCGGGVCRCYSNMQCPGNLKCRGQTMCVR